MKFVECIESRRERAYASRIGNKDSQRCETRKEDRKRPKRIGCNIQLLETCTSLERKGKGAEEIGRDVETEQRRGNWRYDMGEERRNCIWGA